MCLDEAHDTPVDRGMLPCSWQVPRLAVLPSPPLQQYVVPPLPQSMLCWFWSIVGPTGFTGFAGLVGLGTAKALPARTIAAKVKAFVKCILVCLMRTWILEGGEIGGWSNASCEK